jgi:CheY-like chemotaxis protein
MIVDDEEDTLQLIKTLLEKEGYDIVTASNASECLDKLKEDGVDLVLLDIFMPDMNGRDLCIKIREQKSCPVKIIYLSVMRPADYRRKYGKEELQRLNVVEYITKPFDNRELLSKIESTLS